MAGIKIHTNKKKPSRKTVSMTDIRPDAPTPFVANQRAKSAGDVIPPPSRKLAKGLNSEIKKDALSTNPFLQSRNRPPMKPPSNLPRASVTSSSTPKSYRPLFYTVVFAVFFGLLFIALDGFSSMTVSIIQKQQTLKLTSPVTNRLSAEIITHVYETEENFDSQESTVINRKAKGEIEVINEFGSASQPLVARTRFLDSRGRTYRIIDRVLIPGAQVVNGEIIPSSLRIIVEADASGNEFNEKELLNFTIPGLKGLPQHDKIYARAITPMEGGASGEVLIVSEEEAVSAQQTLEKRVREKLSDQLRSAIPNEMVKLDDSEEFVINIEIDPPIDEPAETFRARAKGQLTAIVVLREEINKMLESILYSDFPSMQNNLELVSLDSLRLQSVSEMGEGVVAIVEIDGNVSVKWHPNLDALESDLLAMPRGILTTPKDAYLTIFKNYEAIDQASVHYSPTFWERVPRKASRIHFELEDN